MKTAPGPGRTKDEVVREARAAYRRRDEELAERRNESEQSRDVVARGRRMWWDGAGMDTAMTPVSEEVTNPMDTILDPVPQSPEVSPRTTEIRRPQLIRQIERWGGERIIMNS